ncbi:MAG TPA: o-succinylbenzoate--CoA ligase [Ignavibacteria bacterium]|nr:o-succinylbenzoate--CoA ligase [Ignavibacteria bacterium]
MHKLIELLTTDKEKITNTKAIVTPRFSITNEEFHDRISKIAGKLSEIGIQKNDLTGILSENNYDTIELIFALWRIGAVPFLLNTRLTCREINGYLDFAKPKLLFIHSDIRAGKSNIHFTVNFYPFDLSNEYYPQNRIESNKENIAVVLFTSGSTRKPKAVALTFNNIISSATNGNELFHHRKGDKWLASLPFYHIGGFSILVRASLFGCTIVIPEKLTTNAIKEAIDNYSPTHISLVTTQLKRLLEINAIPNKELRMTLLGGGFLESSLIKKSLIKGWHPVKSYGSTETASFVTALKNHDYYFAEESAGKPLSNIEILIVDKNKNPLQPMKSGEIVIKSESIAKYYLNNPEETSLKFSDGVYYSGDYGYLDEKGYLYIEVRREDLIISGGENINPLEVEREIRKFDNIEEVCVLGEDNKEWGQLVIAAIVTKNRNTFSLEVLRDFLNNKLASYKHPRKIYFMSKLPRTELGKVQKDILSHLIKVNDSLKY